MTLAFRLLAFLCAAAIVFLSLEPAREVQTVLHADKVKHFAAYAVLCGLTGLGWPRLRLPLLIGLVALFGAGMEIAQALAGTGRTPSVLDALANLCGAACAGGMLHLLRR
ncbi:hypothetical protein [uncultured Algimonas sp.]|uniref:VanZ family protein n=1 Tax=uncultured Algimonas sp. TaxID=1547920 RepID=UPI00262F1504|nr:hypothetical protein [uncultured Algimonas sp.]